MSHFLLTVEICFVTYAFILRYEYLATSFSICKANSRVGAKTKTFGPFRSDRGIDWNSVWIIAGSKNANVLPGFNGFNKFIFDHFIFDFSSLNIISRYLFQFEQYQSNLHLSIIPAMLVLGLEKVSQIPDS